MLLDKNLGWIIITAFSYTYMVILIMHFLQQNKNPTGNAISEYVGGPYRAWITSTFFIQSIGSIAVSIVVIRINSKKPKALFGSIITIIAALGCAIAGSFPADPISVNTMTTNGLIHTVGGLTQFVSLAVGLPLLSSGKKNMTIGKSLEER